MIAGIKQSELARIMGVTPGTVCQWETGRSYPDVGKLKKLAVVLNTTIEELLVEERAM